MAKEIKSELQKQADRVRVVTEQLDKAREDELEASVGVQAAEVLLIEARRTLTAVRAHRFALQNIQDNERVEAIRILENMSPMD
jgi:hypothetical protein